MIFIEITDIIEEFYAKKTRHRLHRKYTIKKKQKRIQIINQGITNLSAGFINETKQSQYYIKYPKNSKQQKKIKRLTSHICRNYKNMPLKGNKYRRLFDYYWTLT